MNDWMLVSLSFEFSGTLLLIFRDLFKSKKDAAKESLTFYGQNPYLYKSQLFNKKKTLVGFSFLFIGFLLLLVTCLNAIYNNFLPNLTIFKILYVVFLIACLVLLGESISDWFTQRDFHGWFFEDGKNGIYKKIENLKSIINKNGVSVENKENARKEILIAIIRIGDIYGINRKRKESDKLLIERILKIFKIKNLDIIDMFVQS